MTLKLERKIKRIWRKSARRLTFGGLKKIAVVVLLVGLNWAGIAAVGQTVSYFNDEENSSGNIFGAATLDMTILPDNVYASGLMYPTDTTVTTINLINNGTLPYQYTIHTEVVGGSESCDYFNLMATDGHQSYSGPISDLASTASVSSSGGAADWTFTFSLSPSVPPAAWGQSCFFKWVFTAWQTDFSDPAGGFNDTEERLGVLRIGKAVVLNEFIPNPTGLDNAPKPGGEWVELYNNSSMSFDVAGWAVYDSDDSHELYITAGNTNTGNTVIPAHGFLVVYRNGDGDFELNNDADSVRLFTGRISEGDVLVDSYNYSSGKPEGFSYARIPDGVGAWVDPVPTPGGPNVLSENETAPEEVVVENVASLSFSETLELAASAISEFIISDSGQIASESQEMTVGEEIVTSSGSFNDVASESFGNTASSSAEPTVTPAPEPSATPEVAPETSPEITTEPADNQQLPTNDDNLIQAPTEPAIPVEPVTIEQPAEPVLPPIDPPASPSELPVPAPEAPAVPTE